MAASLKSWSRSVFQISRIRTTPTVQARGLSVSPVLRNESSESSIREDGEEGAEDSTKKGARKVVDAETSVRYLNSKAFVQGYGDKPVWHHYRRNFKGQIPPMTRRTCIDTDGNMKTGNPCPICRDEYLVLDSTNVKLLDQFVSPYTGEIFDTKVTCLCQKQHKTLVAEVMKAWDQGRLEKKLPFRQYNYDEYKNE